MFQQISGDTKEYQEKLDMVVRLQERLYADGVNSYSGVLEWYHEIR